MQWVVDNWLLHSSGTQMFFQWAVVLAEIIIGLCLITGTLTFLASAASVGLQAGFVLTTGLYLGTWWMLFAGFAMMGGAGRAFGVDHYLLPYLNNYWERIWKARRWTPWFDRALARSDR